MSDNEQTQVPEWAKGEGWEWDCFPGFANIAIYRSHGFPHHVYIRDTDDGALLSMIDKSSVQITEVRWGFPTPEDARHIADCLIAGKVLPSKREKELGALVEEYKSIYVWRSIEWAPRDGTRFLGTSRGCDIHTYFWRRDENPGWCIEYADGPGWEPTHWVPFPKPLNP